MPGLLIFTIGTLAGLIVYSYFGTSEGNPSKFQIHRVFKIANFLDKQIDSALVEGTIDSFGNLNVVARNNQFLTYKGFLERDVKSVTRLMAERKGFRNGLVEFGHEHTTFMFKLLDR